MENSGEPISKVECAEVEAAGSKGLSQAVRRKGAKGIVAR